LKRSRILEISYPETPEGPARNDPPDRCDSGLQAIIQHVIRLFHASSDRVGHTAFGASDDATGDDDTQFWRMANPRIDATKSVDEGPILAKSAGRHPSSPSKGAVGDGDTRAGILLVARPRVGGVGIDQ